MSCRAFLLQVPQLLSTPPLFKHSNRLAQRHTASTFLCPPSPSLLQLFDHYWGKPEATKEAFDPEGYFITGGLGQWEQGGGEGVAWVGGGEGFR